MNQSALTFAMTNLLASDISGKKVLEIGSALTGAPSQRGNFRSIATSWGCHDYLGIDSEFVDGVDRVIQIEDLASHKELNNYDLVLCFEVLEHVKDWRLAINNIKKACAIDGTIIITTRSVGFPYHSFPKDFWRFNIDDMNLIFSDFSIKSVVNDPIYPGVFLCVKKKQDKYIDLSKISLYSIITNRRILNISNNDFKHPLFLFKRGKDQLANSIVSIVKWMLRFNKHTT